MGIPLIHIANFNDGLLSDKLFELIFLLNSSNLIKDSLISSKVIGKICFKILSIVYKNIANDALGE